MKILWCFKGDGGGGGGGTGLVDYPQYMKDFQGNLLNHTGTDSINSSLIDVMNSALANNPYDGYVAYDPDTELTQMLNAIDDLRTVVNLLSDGNGLDDIIANILDDSRIDDSITEFSADLGVRLNAEVLPRFEAGMRDINAVTSSAFALGKAVIEDGNTRQVARYSADLHMNAFGDVALRLVAFKLEYQRMLSTLQVEANRIKIVARSEERSITAEFEEAEASWDIGLFQHGGNLLASIGGGVISSDKKKRSTTATALGGGLSGAVAGAMIGAQYGSSGGYYGAAIGAVVGAGAALLAD